MGLHIRRILFASFGAVAAVSSATCRFQAEESNAWFQCATRNEHANFDGTGYADCGDKGSWIEWNTPISHDGMYDLSVRYASTEDRPVDLFIDGSASKAATIDAVSTLDWSKWKTASAPDIELFVGNHTIRISAMNNRMPNLDFLEITPRSFHIDGYRTKTVLSSGSHLDSNNYVTSLNKGYSTGLDPDGDFVFHVGSPVRWRSNVARSTTNRLHQQRDGNLVLRNKSGDSLWSSKTYKKPGSQLVISDGGHAAVMHGATVLARIRNPPTKSPTRPPTKPPTRSPTPSRTPSPTPPPTPLPTPPPTSSPTEESTSIFGYRYVVVLEPNSHLERNEYATSRNGKYKLGVDGSGNFVLKEGSNVLWHAGVSNGDRLNMQTDSNLVLRDSNGIAVWHSATHREDEGSASLALTDGGMMVLLLDPDTPILVLPPTPEPTAAPTTTPSRVMGEKYEIVIACGESIDSSDGFVSSPNGAYSMGMDADGDLVLRSGTNVMWRAGVNGKDCSMQTDGNLVIYKAGQSLWSSSTSERGSNLVVTDGGFAAIVIDEEPVYLLPPTPAPTPAPTWSTLRINGYLANTVIRSGASLSEDDGFQYSPNGQYSFGIVDGDIVLRSGWLVTWRAGISGAHYIRQQTDGNLIARNENGNSVWATDTYGSPGAILALSDEPALAITLDSIPLVFLPVMDATTFLPSFAMSADMIGGFMYTTVMASGGYLYPGQLAASPNGEYIIELTNTGDLVMSDDEGGILWNAAVSGADRVRQQTDGNLIIFGEGDDILWTSRTGGNDGARFIIDSGGQAGVFLDSTPLFIIGKPRGQYTGPPSESLPHPCRAMFYYPWYPETWKVGGEYAHHEPSLGFYSSNNPDVVANHTRQLQYAHTQLAIASWWGPDTNADRARLPMLMDETLRSESTMKWTIYFEDEFFGDPSSASIASDLDYLKKWFAWHPTWAHEDGRPLLFVYNNGPTEGCDVVDRWVEANGDKEWYVVMKVFSGYQYCANQPDSWHQYGPATAVIDVSMSFSVSPGFWLANEESPRLERVSKDAWKQNVEAMTKSDAHWHLITTFNEAGEGTMIESSNDWQSESGYGFYLDALHEFH